jgi:hypothetical protein
MRSFFDQPANERQTSKCQKHALIHSDQYPDIFDGMSTVIHLRLRLQIEDE